MNNLGQICIRCEIDKAKELKGLKKKRMTKQLLILSRLIYSQGRNKELAKEKLESSYLQSYSLSALTREDIEKALGDLD